MMILREKTLVKNGTLGAGGIEPGSFRFLGGRFTIRGLVRTGARGATAPTKF